MSTLCSALTHRSKRAFTLIELLVVILIIAILIAVAAPSFLGQQDKAKDSAVKSDLALVHKAAKADSITDARAQGTWATGTDLVGAITRSEPQLDDKVSVTDTPAAERYGVCASSNANTLRVVAHSASGNAWLVEAPANGRQRIDRGTCAGFDAAATFAPSDEGSGPTGGSAALRLALDKLMEDVIACHADGYSYNECTDTARLARAGTEYTYGTAPGEVWVIEPGMFNFDVIGTVGPPADNFGIAWTPGGTHRYCNSPDAACVGGQWQPVE